MFESVSDGVKKFKEIYSNRKYKALIKLGLWFLFFIVLGLLFEVNNDSTNYNLDDNIKVSALETFKNMNSYDYQYALTGDNDVFLNISGTRHYNEQLFNMNDKRYYLLDNSLYHIENTNAVTYTIDDYLVNLALLKLNHQNIASLINLGDIQYKKEYNNSKIEINYLVKTVDFIDFFQIDSVQEISDTYISITTLEEQEKIVSVIIDMTEYLSITLDKSDFNVLEINYSNVNNINNLNVDFEIPDNE